MTSSHPAVAAALHAHSLVDSAIGETVSVDFGPVPGTTIALESVAVGFSTEDVGAVTGQVEPGGLGSQIDRWEIGCMAQSVSGDVTIEAAQAHLARGYELMELVGAAVLAGDGERGTTWEGVVRHQAQWVVTDSGPGALVIFYIAGYSIRGMTTG